MFLPSNPFVCVCDADECLVGISDKWVKKAIKDPLIAEYLKDTGKYDIISSQHANFREDYYIEAYFGVTDKSLKRRVNQYYWDDKEFYSDLKPLALMNSLYSIKDLIKELHIVSHVGLDKNAPCNNSKLRWLVAYLKAFNLGDKLTINMLESSKPKSSFIIENNIKPNTIIDDSPKVVKDIAVNGFPNTYMAEFIIPLYGYNKSIDGLDLFEKNFSNSFLFCENNPSEFKIDPSDKNILVAIK